MRALDRLYEVFTDDPDADNPAGDDVRDEVVDEVPRNFSLNALNGASTKLAEQLASPGAVLALLIGAVSAPVAFVGLLEPTRRAGSLVPQLAVAGRIRSSPIRKRWWAGAGTVQGLSLAAMLLAAATMEGVAAGIAIVALLAIFSLASGVGSVAFSDVVGKTVPESKRGQLLALRSTAGGLFTIVAGLALLGLSSSDDLSVFLVLLGCAAALWLLAAALFAGIAEPEGRPQAERSALEEARAGAAALREVPGLRAFSIARGLLVAVEVAVPFLVVFTGAEIGTADLLALVVLSIGVANLLSNYAWGRISDRISTRVTMISAGAIGSLSIGGVIALGALAGPDTPAVAFAPVFAGATVAEAGIRNGRKAWVVNAAPPSERPLWVAATNTLAGLVTLSFAVLGVVAQVATVEVVVYVLLALSLAGIAAAALMPEDGDVAAG